MQDRDARLESMLDNQTALYAGMLAGAAVVLLLLIGVVGAKMK